MSAGQSQFESCERVQYDWDAADLHKRLIIKPRIGGQIWYEGFMVFCLIILTVAVSLKMSPRSSTKYSDNLNT